MSEVAEDAVMTEKVVVLQCKKHHGYSTPELNEKLYLHHLGFTAISCLDKFYQCRVIYLNNNKINNLEGLYPLRQLHTLYLSNNVLQDCISLPQLPSLRLLDVSNNAIRSVEGLANAPALETILISHNRIVNLQGLETLKDIMTLDVSYNCISQSCDIMPFIVEKKNLRTCLMHGNHFVRSMPFYRKKMIANISSLRFLDEYPVFPEERRCAEAFALGGVEAENVQRNVNEEEKTEEKKRQFEFFAEVKLQGLIYKETNGPITDHSVYYEDNYEDSDVFVPL